MELHVHELRRNLRWISIYAQSLRGIVVLKDSQVKYHWEKDFVPESAAGSPYNKLPIKKGLKHYTFFNKKAFCALTFVIEELGKIKDEGLEIESLAKAIEKTVHYRSNSSTKLAVKALGSDQTLKQLLEKAHKLMYAFFVTHQIPKALITIR